MDFTLSLLCFVSTVGIAVVAAVDPSFLSEAQGLSVMQGGNVTLFCKVENLGAKNVIWSHDIAFLSMNHMVVGGDTNRLKIRGKYNLRITNVTLADEGRYVCQVSSIPPITQVSYLNVTVPPHVEMLNETVDIEATLKDNITLSCAATGKPKPNITWTREGGKLPSGKEFWQGDSLHLKNLQYDNGGIYKCTAFNGVGEADDDTVRLNVFYPPMIHSKSKMIYTGPGIRTKIPCIVSGQPRPKIEWRHNGTNINLRNLPQHMEMLFIEKGFKTDFSLVVRGLEERDLGTYSCKVTNKKGTDFQKIVVTALPGQVMITSPLEGNYSSVYDLSWKVSTPVLPKSYKIMMRERNDTYEGGWDEIDVNAKTMKDASEHAQTHTIKELTPNTEYEVVVRALNRYGEGEASQSFVFKTNAPGFTPPPSTQAPKVKTHSGKRTYDPGSHGNRPHLWLPAMLFIVASIMVSSWNA